MNKSVSAKTRCAMLLALVVTKGLAQAAPQANAQANAAADKETLRLESSAESTGETITLDPFSVTTDHEGYRATDTLGGARVRAKLADTPSSISVVTPKLMQDLGITNAQDLLIYTTSTEVAGLNGNYSGVTSRGFGAVGAAEGTRLSNPAGTNRARGLTAMDSTRNYFVSEIPWDGFNISRVDISRGPNSFLFGVGSPSGISNVTTNEANYKNKGSFEVKTGSFGTVRESLDYNQVLIQKELAIRFDLLNDETKYQQKPAYNHSKRAYGTLRYDPKFLDFPSAHTKIQVNVEKGKVDSNNPRELPPLDFISGYFSSTMNKKGYNPFTYNPGSYQFDPTTSPWTSNNDIHYAWGNNATFWFDGTNGSLIKASQAGVGGANSPAGLNGVSNVYNLYTTGFSQYAINVNATNPNLYKGAAAKTVNYLDKSLTDRSIFDFYNKLIDGPNKHEWQDWNAYNVSLVQSLLNNHLVIQAVADRQEYTRGNEGPLTGYITPYISVDLNSYLLTYPTWIADGSLATANPNVGRPFIAGDYAGGDSSSKYTHSNYQGTAAASFNFDEVFGKTELARMLGRHELTALWGKYSTKQENRTWNMYATDQAYGQASGLGLTLAQNNVNWVAYLGPSLTGKTSASGLNLSNIANTITPTSTAITTWSNTWTAGTSVNASDPWTNPMPTGSFVSTQAANPANYAGYKPLAANILSSKNNIDQLYTQGNKAEQVLTSKALMYQGHLLDDVLIPSIGYRRDSVLQRGTQASIYSTTGLANMNYEIDDNGVRIDTNSTSYGLAVHLPKFLKAKLPEGTDVSVYYFHGANQTPKVRYGIDGTMLANESGKTDDYSIQFDGFHGRASLRLGYFKTVDNNAQASYGQPLGSAGWMIDSLPSWTLTMAAAGIAASRTTVDKLPSDMAGASWYWGWGAADPALATRVATAIQKDFAAMFPQSYWDAYDLPIDMTAVKNGDWLHVVKNGMSPFAWNVNNTHLVHGTTPIIDQNIVSKGYELEATVKPLRNWDITFNASKIRAYQTSLGAGADKYLNNMAAVWLNSDVGLTGIWGNASSSGNARAQFMQNIWAPYLTQVALTGTDQPELRKWNFKLINNYTVDRGMLKGLNVGGAYRWASKQVLGYGIKNTTLFGNSAYIADVTQPIYGSIDEHVDLWIGYQHKLTKKIDWRVQLNLRNAFEKPSLTPISVEPDGTPAQQRIQMGQVWDLSCKFMF